MRQQKILIVDERPTRLRRLRDELASSSRWTLLPTADNLTDAYNLTEIHRPDVILLGSAFPARPEFLMFRALMDTLRLRCIVLGGLASRDASKGLGLEFAAVDDDGGAQTLHAILGDAAPVSSGPTTRAVRQPTENRTLRCVVIGASTGGVEALLGVLSDYPAMCPPTLIVQHIRTEFTAGLVSRLDRHCAAKVSAASDGDALVPGQVLVAPDDRHHLVVQGGSAPRCRLVAGDPVCGHRPSVDMLFRSAASLGPSTVGVLLTGMGRDGAEGLLEIRRKGGHTIAQDRETCTVHGMPRVAVEMGAVRQELPLPRIGQAILAACRIPAAAAG